MSRLRRLFGDTLFKRLFVLMWLALVGSHVIAWGVATGRLFGDTGEHAVHVPTFPSLPPTPGLSDPPPGPPPGPPHAAGGPPEGPPPGPGAASPGAAPPSPAGLPTSMLLLDYGVRLLVIGLAAWWGARWLSAPMRRLTHAAGALAGGLGRDAAPAKLDDTRGTVEVRETARVFNEMAAALDRQFRARGLLAAALSHDLRTPLTRMRLRLETMEPGDAVAAQRCIADLREMNALIDTSLQVFRDAGSTEPPQRIEVLALVEAIADDQLELGHAVEVDGTAAVALAQPVALRRALTNLIVNAVRYGERAQVEVDADAQQVRVRIDDRGPGIPDDQLDAVFQPFFRLDHSRSRDTGGTGLGLYIAKDLLTKQGATLSLANRPQGGLRVTITLPRG